MHTAFPTHRLQIKENKQYAPIIIIGFVIPFCAVVCRGFLRGSYGTLNKNRSQSNVLCEIKYEMSISMPAYNRNLHFFSHHCATELRLDNSREDTFYDL